MNGPGFDWLNITGVDTHNTGTSPAPPVLFGVTPKSSSSSLNNMNQSTHQSYQNQNHNGTHVNNNNTNNHNYYPENGDRRAEEEIPLSLTSADLTPKEAKTYIRWYNNIISKKGTKTITLEDVFTFLCNFRLEQLIKHELSKIFMHHSSSLNIGQFFALLRLISHSISGLPLERRLIKSEAPIPTPVPILSKRRQSEVDTEDDDEQAVQSESDKSNPFALLGGDNSSSSKKLDLDSFTQFMLTGKRPQKKKLKGKRVKFSDQIVTDIATEPKHIVPEIKLDMSLPMNQLLGKVPPQRGVTVPSSSNDEDEEEELKDMQESISHFQNVNIDSVSIHGVPSNIPPVYFNGNGTPLESPDSSLDSRSSTPDFLNSQSSLPGRNQQMLRPNLTGPAQMANMMGNTRLSLSLTGSPSNGNIHAFPTISIQPTNNEPPRLSATLTGSTPRSSSLLSPPIPPKSRNRSNSSPIPHNPQNGLGNNPRIPSPLAYSNQLDIQYSMTVPPPPPPSRGRSSYGMTPPPPPRSRHRTVSNDSTQPAPPLPPKISINLNSSDPSLNNGVYGNGFPASNNDSTADILGDLKVLEQELERIRAMTGSF